MIHDARGIESGSGIEADLAIIGAGAAGISIALALRDAGLRIVLIESGGKRAEPRTQALCEATLVGQPYPYFEHARLRCLGGSTEHWDGGCAPLDPDDLEARDWVPASGWPLRHDELLSWYARAQEVCELDGFDGYLPEMEGPRPLRLDSERIESRLWQFKATRFGSLARSNLARGDQVQVLLNATVVGLQANAYGSAVEQLEVRTLAGNRFQVRARAFVLAGGGLENPRLLLLANQGGATPLGTAVDAVGRFFMEHLAVMTGRVKATTAEIWRFYDTFPGGRARRRGYLCLAPGARRAHRLLHAAWRVDSFGLAHRQAIRRLLRSAGRSSRLSALARDFAMVVGGPGTVLREAWRPLNASRGHRTSAGFVLWGIFEQAPNPDSRIRLARRVDAFGLPRLEIDWRLSELDHQSIRGASSVLVSTLAESGCGRVEAFSGVRAASYAPVIEPTFHHMGATRMSHSAREGVVDADCRVHGVGNLFVAGSSVFPTGGWANPTLTIVALALRLAAQLRGELLTPKALSGLVADAPPLPTAGLRASA